MIKISDIPILNREILDSELIIRIDRCAKLPKEFSFNCIFDNPVIADIKNFGINYGYRPRINKEDMKGQSDTIQYTIVNEPPIYDTKENIQHMDKR